MNVRRITRTVTLGVLLSALWLSFLPSRLVPLVEGAAASAASRAGEAPFTFDQQDIALLEQSEQLERQLEKEGLVYEDEELEKYLNQVGQAVVPRRPPPERVRWRFRVARDPYPNAFALPNGSIYVNTGLLSRLENESQLAGVLAHESAHVLEHHAFAQNKKLRKTARDKYVLDVISTWAPVFGNIGTAVSIVANVTGSRLVASIFGYSREVERDADLYAADRLLELNYDAQEWSRTFRLLETTYEAEYAREGYQDHPPSQKRIDYTNARLSSAKAGPVSAEQRAIYRLRYLSRTEEVLRHDIRLNLANGRFRTAFVLGQKLVDFKPGSAENVFHLAEVYRALGPRLLELKGEELTRKGLKRSMNMTREEEERELLSTPAGQAALRTNLANAEELYRRALELDPKNASAHRGLGFLLEQEQRPQEALAHYREYLRLAPQAIDRTRIRNRVEALELIK